MNRTSLTIALLASIGLTSTAFAGELYTGVGYGTTSTSGATLGRNTGNASTIFAGYQFTPYVAAEVQYGDFGTIQGPAASPQIGYITGLNTSVVGTFPVSDKLSVLGKVGISATQVAFPEHATTASNIGVSYGIGAQYSVTEKLAVRLGYDVYPVGNDYNMPKGTTSVQGISLVYKF